MHAMLRIDGTMHYYYVHNGMINVEWYDENNVRYTINMFRSVNGNYYVQFLTNDVTYRLTGYRTLEEAINSSERLQIINKHSPLE